MSVAWGAGAALVGATGFVGGNLLAQREFGRTYSSKDSASIIGEEFDLVVFSAARAEKWRINQDPESDLLHIEELERLLAGIQTRKLVLISTVDVYGTPVGVDESTEIPVDGLHAYGRHRLRLEQTARELHERVLVLRLPGLFGAGIKKNVVYDLLHDNNVDRIHHAGSFQYYSLDHLADDIDRAHSADLDLVNLATEPVTTAEVAAAAFGIDFRSEPEGVTPGSYDVHSRHTAHWGREGHYLYGRDQVLGELAAFVAAKRASETAS